MGWNTAVLALLSVTVISIFAGLMGGRTREYRGLLLDYLLADQTLGRQSVVQLLFSGSFSLNGMLYQVWLGYAIGLWALIVQGAWAISYVLLSPYSEQLLEAKSLHSFLGARFGERTKVIAGI